MNRVLKWEGFFFHVCLLPVGQAPSFHIHSSIKSNQKSPAETIKVSLLVTGLHKSQWCSHLKVLLVLGTAFPPARAPVGSCTQVLVQLFWYPRWSPALSPLLLLSQIYYNVAKIQLPPNPPTRNICLGRLVSLGDGGTAALCLVTCRSRGRSLGFSCSWARSWPWSPIDEATSLGPLETRGGSAR